MGVKTVANTAPTGNPARLNAIALQCAIGDAFNYPGEANTLDLSGVGQAVLLQYDNVLSVWYVVSANLDRGVTAAGIGPVVAQGQTITQGQTVNTGAFLQSSTGQDPSLTVKFNEFLENGSAVAWGVANNFDAALATTLSTGAAITSLPTLPLPLPIGSGVVLTLNDGAGHTQTWTTTAAVAAGATSIPVSSQTPSYAFPGTTTTIYFSLSSATSTFQLMSAVYNTGTRSTVAVAGFAIGANVWGANFVTNVQAGNGGGPSPSGKGVEIDFGIVAANTGTCLGLHLAASGASGNAAQFINMNTEGLGVPGPAYGITTGVLLPTTITTTGSAQTPDVSGELVASATIPLTPGWSTTVALASNGLDVSTFVGSQTLFVNGVPSNASVSGGLFAVATSSGMATLSYTGIGSGSLTGVSRVFGSGTLSTGGAVSGGGWGYPGIPLVDAGHPGMFAYAGNYHEFTGLTATSFTNDTLTGVSLFAGESISVPASASVVIGTQPFGAVQGVSNLTSSFLRVMNAATMASGLDLSHGIFTNEAIAVPVNSTVSGNGLLVQAAGGGLSPGAGVVFNSADALSTASYGIRVIGVISLPAGVTAAQSTGGSFASGTTRYWVITALNSHGQTSGSAEVSVTFSASGSSCVLNWTAVNGATGYKLYRATTSGGESVSPSLVATISSGLTTTSTDTGAATTTGSVPPTNAAYQQFVDSTGYVFYVDGGQYQTGLAMEGASFTGQAIAIPVNSQTAGDGLVVLATGGGFDDRGVRRVLQLQRSVDRHLRGALPRS